MYSISYHKIRLKTFIIIKFIFESIKRILIYPTVGTSIENNFYDVIKDRATFSIAFLKRDIGAYIYIYICH